VLAVSLDGVEVLIEFRRKVVRTAFGFGYEVQIRNVSWMQRGLDGLDARIRNRSGRKARVRIGVVGVGAGQVTLIDGPAVAVGARRRVWFLFRPVKQW
jgi:hypothetical protein